MAAGLALALLAIAIAFGLSSQSTADPKLAPGVVLNTPPNWPVHATVRINGDVALARIRVGGLGAGGPVYDAISVTAVPPVQEGRYAFDVIWNEYHTGRSWRLAFDLPSGQVPANTTGNPGLIFTFEPHGRFSLFSLSQGFLALDHSDPIASRQQVRDHPEILAPVLLHRACGLRDKGEDIRFAEYLRTARMASELIPDPTVARKIDNEVPNCEPANWEVVE